jgi:hypothetical protein
MSRQASLLAADEVNFSISGKINVFGIYTTDINIFTDPSSTTQLVFLFVIETDPDDPYQEITIRVDLPGGDTRQQVLAVKNFRDGAADKIRWSLKQPLLFQGPILRPGPIVAQVIHEKGILFPAAPFIVMHPQVAQKTIETH